MLSNTIFFKPMGRFLAFALAFLLALPTGFAQSAQNVSPPKDAAPDSKPASKGQPLKDSAAPTADANLVTLPVTVRDKHGAILKDLTANDFTLLENGRPQPIEYFSLESNLPLTLGLLLDTSSGQREALDQERNASRSFFDQMLTQEKDKAFLLHFDHEVELLQDLTHSREKLQSALEELKTADEDSGRSNRSNTGDSRSDSEKRPPRTQLYDALYLTSNEVLKKQPWRKAVIVLSDGVDRGSKTTLESAIEAAQRANVVVYAIYVKGEQRRERRDEGYPGGGGGPYPGGGPFPGGGGGYPGGGRRGGGNRQPQEPKVDGKKILQRISKDTGGRFFEVTKRELFGDAYASISEELRSQYRLAFTPDKDAAGEGYHHVVVQVKKKDVVVQTPEGYYGTGES